MASIKKILLAVGVLIIAFPVTPFIACILYGWVY